MKKKIIIVLIVLIGILAISMSYMYFFTDFFKNKGGNTQNNPNTTASSTNNTTVDPKVKEINTNTETKKTNTVPPIAKPSTPGVVSKSDLENIAASFAERFGSYSNQSNFSNLSDLKIFMTDSMRKWAETYVDQQKSKAAASDIYYGVVTKAVAHEIKEYNDETGIVIVLVQTRRRESVGSSSNSANAFNQNITVTFNKERGAWKVASAIWANR